jgi:hypothetical protein
MHSTTRGWVYSGEVATHMPDRKESLLPKSQIAWGRDLCKVPQRLRENAHITLSPLAQRPGKRRSSKSAHALLKESHVLLDKGASSNRMWACAQTPLTG